MESMTKKEKGVYTDTLLQAVQEVLCSDSYNGPGKCINILLSQPDIYSHSQTPLE